MYNVMSLAVGYAVRLLVGTERVVIFLVRVRVRVGVCVCRCV